MTKLKLGAIEEGRPIKLTLELPPLVDRNLTAYAEALGQQSGQPPPDRAKLALEMLVRFMATDRAFSRFRRNARKSESTA